MAAGHLQPCKLPAFKVSYTFRTQRRTVTPYVSMNRGSQTSTSATSGQVSETSVGYGDGNAPWEVLQNIGIRNKAEVARILDIAENPKSLLQSKHDKDERGNPLARKLDVNEDIRPVLRFLLENGFTQPEISKLIIEYPILLCYNPEDRLKPLFEYLKSIGIENPDRLVMKRPSVLGIDTDKGLRRIVEYLQENKHTPDQIENLLATSL